MSSHHVDLTSYIVSAYVSNNTISPTDLPGILAEVHAALVSLDSPPVAVPEKREPAVPIRRSVKPEAITCLECGKAFKSLKRHLMVSHEVTPDQYRVHWGLAYDYPMVAPAYSEVRTELAKTAGLGRKPAVKKAARRRSQGLAGIPMRASHPLA